MIKYRFAYNNDKTKIISINDINSDEKEFFCISCGQQLIARRGKKRDHHFAHKVVNSSCSLETYLHILAKDLLYNDIEKRLQNNKPLIMKIPTPYVCQMCNEVDPDGCLIKVKVKEYNLLKDFRIIEKETREGKFIPDLMLKTIDKSRKIFLEIAYTHLCSEEKKASGNEIIEYVIKTEEDAISIVNFPLEYPYPEEYFNEDNDGFIQYGGEQGSINFYNFAIKPAQVY